MNARRFALAALVATVAFAVAFPGAWRIPFHNLAEPMEGMVLQEMVRTDDWVLPRRNGREIPSKPLLYHWMALGWVEVRGTVDELTTRLPSMTASALTAATIFAAGAGAWGTPAGLAGALVLMTSPEWAKWAVTARTDATFALFIAVAILFGDRWLRTNGFPWLVLTAVGTGLATLAKGPAGAGLVGLVLAVEVWRRGAWDRLRPGRVAIGVAVFLALAGSWYAAALVRGGEAFFEKQILAENVFRFLPHEGGPSRDHHRLYYFPTLLVGMLPWSLALPPALWLAWKRRADDPLSSLCVTWIVVVFVVCTAASGKRSNYLLPLYPAGALLVGRWCALRVGEAVHGGRDEVPRGVAITTAVILSVLTVLLGSWAAGLEPWRPVLPFLHPRDQATIPQVAAQLGEPSFWIVAATGLGGVLFATVARLRAWRLFPGLVAASMLLLVVLGSLVRRTEAQFKSVRDFTERVARHVDGEPLSFYRQVHHGVVFYLDRNVPVEPAQFERLPAPGWALVWQDDWKALPEGSRRHARVVEESPPEAPGRPDTRLLLIRLEPARH